jgi:hypothetical protein
MNYESPQNVISSTSRNSPLVFSYPAQHHVLRHPQFIAALTVNKKQKLISIALYCRQRLTGLSGIWQLYLLCSVHHQLELHDASSRHELINIAPLTQIA